MGTRSETMRSKQSPCPTITKHSHEALDWLEDLHEPKRFVFRTTKKTDQELNLQIELQDLEKGTTYQTQALLDSGCMGSCISQWFVKEKKLSLHKWEHPISTYNGKQQWKNHPLRRDEDDHRWTS